MSKMSYGAWKGISAPTICNLTECAVILLVRRYLEISITGQQP